MRKLKAYVHIKAPVHKVQSLTEADRRHEFMPVRRNLWLRTLAEHWETTEWEGGTRLSVQVHYRSRLPFLEGILADGVQQSVANSLSRLKHMAETNPN